MGEEQVEELSDQVIELVIAQARKMGEADLAPLSCLMLYSFRGALGREPQFPNAIGRIRNNGWSVGSMLFWESEGDDERHRLWSDGLMDELRDTGFTTGGVYGNVQQLPDEDRQRRSFGEANWTRLREVKAKYDPDNFFHVNHNIRPRSEGR